MSKVFILSGVVQDTKTKSLKILQEPYSIYTHCYLQYALLCLILILLSFLMPQRSI